MRQKSKGKDDDMKTEQETTLCNKLREFIEYLDDLASDLETEPDKPEHVEGERFEGEVTQGCDTFLPQNFSHFEYTGELRPPQQDTSIPLYWLDTGDGYAWHGYTTGEYHWILRPVCKEPELKIGDYVAGDGCKGKITEIEEKRCCIEGVSWHYAKFLHHMTPAEISKYLEEKYAVELAGERCLLYEDTEKGEVRIYHCRDGLICYACEIPRETSWYAKARREIIDRAGIKVMSGDEYNLWRAGK